MKTLTSILINKNTKDIFKSLFWFGAYFLLSIGATIPVVFIMIMLGINPESEQSLIILTILFTPITFLTLFFYKKTYKEDKILLLEKGNLLKKLIVIILGYISFMVSSVALSILFKTTESTETAKLIGNSGLSGAFLAVIIAPLSEELLFRGLFRHSIKNDVLFIVVNSILFGLMHFQNTGIFINDIYPIIGTGIGGVILSLSYLKTKDIKVPITIHALFNLTAVILLHLR